MANHPSDFPTANILVVADSDKVNKSKFIEELSIDIKKLKSKNPLLKVVDKLNESLKNQGQTVNVCVLTVPDSLEKQLADSIRRQYSDEVKDSTDDETVRRYCNLRYRCDEEKMLAEYVDVVGS